jgi:hypothetical protein
VNAGTIMSNWLPFVCLWKTIHPLSLFMSEEYSCNSECSTWRKLLPCLFPALSQKFNGLTRGWACLLRIQLLLVFARAVILGSSPAGLMTKFYCLRFETPQLGGPRPRIFIPQEQGGPVIPPGTGFPFRRLLRLAELRRISDFLLSSIWKFSSYLTGNTFCLRYKIKLVNAV